MLEGSSRFIKDTRTLPIYTLLDLGSFPALLLDGETSVVGELWEIDDYTAQRLKELGLGEDEDDGLDLVSYV